MALIVDHQNASTTTTLKHFCRICKKGFGCGRALGGHMRAHGIGGDVHIDDDDDDENDNNAAEWDGSGSNPPTNKRMYALRTNPNNRLRSCRACEHCGKEFVSWKSFLEHGKCITDDAESLVSSSPPDSSGAGNWSKRKRSFRAKLVANNNQNINQYYHQQSNTSEDEDLANCLMMLSNAAVETTAAGAEPEESCASASRDELELQERKNNNNNNNIINMNNNNANLTISPASFRVPESNFKSKSVNSNNKGLFECKACKKVFNSHQALGGHRASHKKVKGCFAARNDVTSAGEDDASPHQIHREFFPAPSSSAAPAKRKSKVHECSICHRIFSSGQALGGHKRCHWITSNAGAPADPTALVKFQQFQESIEQINVLAAVAHTAATATATAIDLKLDLNLPANNNNNALLTEMYLQNDNEFRRRNDVVLEDEKNEDEAVMNDGGKKKESGGEEDEADSKVKLAKLSELKDMNGSEGSSPWLQVGIGSTTDVGTVIP